MAQVSVQKMDANLGHHATHQLNAQRMRTRSSLQFTLNHDRGLSLHRILLREAVDAGPSSPLLGVQAILMPILRQWAGDNLLGVRELTGAPSGVMRS